MKALTITALIIAALMSLSGAEYRQVNATHKVSAGETVWQIAEAYMGQQDKTRDIRELVWDIKEANGLKNYYIHAGDVLIVPLYKEK